VPEDGAEDRALSADLVGGGGGDADGWCVDRFAYDAAGRGAASNTASESVSGLSANTIVPRVALTYTVNSANSEGPGFHSSLITDLFSFVDHATDVIRGKS
jgi:hypothetical protein